MPWLELDEDVNNTFRPKVITQDGAEQRQLANMMPLTEDARNRSSGTETLTVFALMY